MTDPHPDATATGPEEQVTRWRERMVARPGVATEDVDELENQLRGHLAALLALGLAADEAFLVAEHRVRSHTTAAEPGVAPAGRATQQAVVGALIGPGNSRATMLPMLGFAALAGLAVRIPFAHALENASGTPYAQLLAMVLALAAVAAAFLAWQRHSVVPGVLVGIGVTITVFGFSQLLYPFPIPSDTQTLALLHVPIAMAVLLGTAYLGRDWRVLSRWMDYIRFLGELVMYYVLIALGGGLFMALAIGVFELVGLAPQDVVVEWILPLGAGGAVIVAAWLVESKKGVVENTAPVLAMVFTPLFTLLLLAFLAAMAATGRLVDLDRNVLILVNLVLVVVLGLHLFSLSARPAVAGPGWFDRLQLLLVVAALVIDLVVLVAMAGRIGEYGASPNKLAALGENLVLAGNLAGSAWLMIGFLRRRRPFAALERWQCRYLPVIGAWAALVVLVFPPLFGFR